MYIRTLRKVFRNPRYVALALLVSSFAFASAVWLPNIPLIFQVVGSNEVTFADKAALLVALLGAVDTNFETLTLMYTSTVTLLFGVYVALTVYAWQRTKSRLNSTAVSFLGMVSGTLGIGCAACGSLVLMSFLGALGLSGVVAYVPFGGAFFGILGVALLTGAIVLILQKIAAPKVCQINEVK